MPVVYGPGFNVAIHGVEIEIPATTMIDGEAYTTGQVVTVTPEWAAILSELDVDLWPYVTDVGDFFMVHHPLVISIPHLPGMGEFVNRQLHQKRHIVRSAEQSHAPNAYVFAHERPYRVAALRRIVDMDWDISNHHWWKVVRDTWMDSENIHENIKYWDELFLGTQCHRVSSRVYFMYKSEREYADAAFEKEGVISIYRGASRPEHAEVGFSWTTDIELAKWFALRFSDVGYVAQGYVAKQNTIAMVSGRDGPEVITTAPLVTEVDEVAR